MSLPIAAVVAILLAPAGTAKECPDGAITNWIEELRSSGEQALRAAYAIDLPPPHCHSALRLLMSAARDPRPRVRRQAVRLLGELDPPPAGVGELLLQSLAEDPDEQVRAHAAMFARRHPAAALPYLVAAASHSVGSRWWDEGQAHAADDAATVLVQIGAVAVPAIIQGMERGLLTRSEALRILEDMTADVTGALISAAERANRETRLWIVHDALGHLEFEWGLRARRDADEARRESPGVWSVAGDEERPDDRGLVCRTFGRLVAIEELRSDVIAAALECSVVARAALDRLGPADTEAMTEVLVRAPGTIAAPAIGKIARAFRHGDIPEETFFAYLDEVSHRRDDEAIRNALGVHVVPLLRSDLRDVRPEPRMRAMKYVESLGDAAAGAAPDLVALLSDPDETVRAAAVSALSTSSATAQTAIIRLLSDPESIVRVAAASKLSSLPWTPETLATIVGFLPDANEDIRWNLARAVANEAPSDTILRALLPLVTTKSDCSQIDEALGDDPFAPRKSPIVPAPEFLASLHDVMRRCDPYGSESILLLMAHAGQDAEPWFRLHAREGRQTLRAIAITTLASLASPDLPAARRDALLYASDEVAGAALQTLRTDASDEEVRLIARIIDGRPVVDDLLDFPTDPPPPPIEEQAIAALYRIGRRGREAAPAVWRHLERQEKRNLETIATLFAILPDARSAAAIEEAFTDPNQYLDPQFLRMLAAIPDLAHEWLLPLMRSGDLRTVVRTLELLARSAPPPDVVAHVSPLLSSPEAEIRKAAVQVLGLFTHERNVRDLLSCLLLDPDPVVRFEVARAFADHQDDVPPEIETILAEQFVADEMNRIRTALADELHLVMPDGPPPSPPPVMTAGPAPPAPMLPAWPLPPPRWSAYDTIPAAVLGKGGDTLEAVHERLAGTLRRLGYATQGIFSTPGGFALMTMVERIHPNGKPYRAPDRWTTSRMQPRNLREYLEILLVEKPGRFRVFVFVITPRPSLGAPAGELTEARAEALLDSALRVLPAVIAGQRYAGRICHVLVYTMEKKAGRRARIVRNDPLLLPGHLRGAGIATALGLFRSRR